jgi:uncharacterized protein (TIGR02271 family)
MDASRNQIVVNEGDDVYGSDGDKVGSVIAVQNDYVVVEKGWFFPTDYYIPASAIASANDGQIYLNVTKDVALDQGWDTVPVATTEYETAAVADDIGVNREPGYTETAATTVSDTEALRVPVYEEELTATKTAREAGGVRIEKDVVTEEQVLDVPVTEERLKVVHRTVDRPVDATDTNAFEEMIVDVPVRTEEVELSKRVRVGEEVEIQKEEVQRTERVAGTVRREEVHVTEATDGTIINDRDRS